MKKITVAGGVYRELCTTPQWDHIYGSAGRAAIALAGHVEDIELHSYGTTELRKRFQNYVDAHGIKFKCYKNDQLISFSYQHCLSTPLVTPPQITINQKKQIKVQDKVVL